MDKNIKELIEYPKQGVLSEDIFKNQEINTSLFCIATGTEISEHTSTKQGIIYVLEGKGIFNLQGKDISMKKGVFIYMKENAVHSLKAEKNTAFLLILMQNLVDREDYL